MPLIIGLPLEKTEHAPKFVTDCAILVSVRILPCIWPNPTSEIWSNSTENGDVSPDVQ